MTKPRSDRPARSRANPAPGAATSAPAGAPVARDPLEQLLDDARAASADAVQFSEFDDRTTRWDYLATFTIADVQAIGVLEFTKQRYGGGRYQVRTRRKDGTYGPSASFSIAGDRKSRSDAAAAVPAQSTAAPVVPAWLTAIAVPVLTALGTVLAKKVLEAPATDPVVLKLLELQAKVGRGESIDPLELQRTIAEAEARGETRGRELGKLTAQRAVDRTADDGVTRIAEAALPRVLGILENATKREPKVTATIRPGGTVERPAQEETTVTTPPAIAAWLPKLAPYAGELVKRARAGADAAATARTIVLDYLPPRVAEAIAESATSETFVADVLEAMPELSAGDVVAWSTTFLEAVQLELTEDGGGEGGDPAPDSAQAVG